ncbi:MAG: alpha-L-fucosidase [Allomuricauda sp.]
MKKLFVTLMMLVPILNIAQLSGGGDLNPDLSPDAEAQNKWMDLRVGLSVHWGPSSLGGKEISWSRDSKINKEIYDNYYKYFDPVKFDAQAWCNLMERWGIKYISPTAKHHDGFALWFSKYTPYDMKAAKRKVDIMAELAKACKKNNIMLGAYYSNLDWFHPDWAPYQYGGPGKLIPTQEDSPNLERYFKFMENQVTELINNYDLAFVQFDGEWDSTYTHVVGSRLYRKFHEVKPSILLSSRIDVGRRMAGKGNHLHLDGLKYAGDFQDRERLVNHGNNVIAWLDHPWQAWVTIDKTQWSYNKRPKLMTKQELIIDLISVVGNNGNYMINLGPRPDGSFEPEQIALMDSLGAWLKIHAEAIYGTRGGPFYPFNEGVSTRKGKNAWVFITDSLATEVALPKTKQNIRSAKVFGTSKKVPFHINTSGNLVFELDRNEFKGFIKVIALAFNEDVTMVDRLENNKAPFGEDSKRITENISFNFSSKDPEWHNSTDVYQLIKEGHINAPYTFHTQKEQQPYVVLDLGEEKKISGLIVKNRADCCQERAKKLKLWVSVDGKKWDLDWEAKTSQEIWQIPLFTNTMGASVKGRELRYLKLGIENEDKEFLHLKNIAVFEMN